MNFTLTDTTELFNSIESLNNLIKFIEFKEENNKVNIIFNDNSVYSVSTKSNINKDIRLEYKDINIEVYDDSFMDSVNENGHNIDGKCIEYDPCSDDNNICDNNATCIRLSKGTSQCKCNSNYYGNGLLCSLLPPNSSTNIDKTDFICDFGYKRYNNECIQFNGCNSNIFNNSNINDYRVDIIKNNGQFNIKYNDGIRDRVFKNINWVTPITNKLFNTKF